MTAYAVSVAQPLADRIAARQAEFFNAHIREDGHRKAFLHAIAGPNPCEDAGAAPITDHLIAIVRLNGCMPWQTISRVRPDYPLLKTGLVAGDLQGDPDARGPWIVFLKFKLKIDPVPWVCRGGKHGVLIACRPATEYIRHSRRAL